MLVVMRDSSDALVNVNKWSYACRHPVVFCGTRFRWSGFHGGGAWPTLALTPTSMHKQMEIWRRGGQSLANSCEAIGRLVDAQNPEHWSQEAGFLAMRTALVSFLKTEDRVIRGETGRFQKFDGDVQTAVAAFTAAEQGNTDELARILAQMESGQTSSGSASAPPSQTSGGSSTSNSQPGSPVGGSASNGGATSSTGGSSSSSSGGANTNSGGSSATAGSGATNGGATTSGAASGSGTGGASGTPSTDQAPVQNKPSEF